MPKKNQGEQLVPPCLGGILSKSFVNNLEPVNVLYFEGLKEGPNSIQNKSYLGSRFIYVNIHHISPKVGYFFSTNATGIWGVICGIWGNECKADGTTPIY